LERYHQKERECSLLLSIDVNNMSSKKDRKKRRFRDFLERKSR
jgi:hypothetical protein